MTTVVATSTTVVWHRISSAPSLLHRRLLESREERRGRSMAAARSAPGPDLLVKETHAMELLVKAHTQRRHGPVAQAVLFLMVMGFPHHLQVVILKLFGSSSCLKFPTTSWLYTVDFAGNPSAHTPLSAETSSDLRSILRCHRFASVIKFLLHKCVCHQLYYLLKGRQRGYVRAR